MAQIPDFLPEQSVIDRYTLSPLVTHNNELVVAGCDEAGRGPLCGPVVAAAVIFKSHEIPDSIKITDSKKMMPTARGAAYEWIKENTIWAVGMCSPTEIDQLNILHASMLAMRRAVENLSVKPDFVLFDGNRVPDGFINTPARKDDIPSIAQFDYISQMQGNDILGRAIVAGDAKSLSIAAASIIAKETRDKIMHELSEHFPQYGWDKNAGYPTASHLQAIKKYGINEHYRKSFKPVKSILCSSAGV